MSASQVKPSEKQSGTNLNQRFANIVSALAQEDGMDKSRVVEMLARGENVRARVQTISEIEKEALEMKVWTPDDIKQFVFNIPSDHDISPATLANFSGALLEMEPSESLEVIIPLLFGNLDSLEFFCLQWLQQLQGHFITDVSPYGILQQQLITLFSAPWNPAVGFFVFSHFFYPFGIHFPGAGYTATLFKQVTGLKNVALLKLCYHLISTHEIDYSRVTYFYNHEDMYHDGRGIGQMIFECFRPLILFKYFTMILLHAETAENQQVVIQIFTQFCLAFPESKFTMLFSDLVEFLNPASSQSGQGGQGGQSGKEFRVVEWERKIAAEAQEEMNTKLKEIARHKD